MVKTRHPKHAKVNRELTNTMINDIFGKTLSITVSTRTVDEFGNLSAISTTSTSFIGDLQFGKDIDQKLTTFGFTETGHAILYIHPEALSTLPEPQDIIVDGNSQWEILSQIESPELNGFVCHYSYVCKRRIIANDN